MTWTDRLKEAVVGGLAGLAVVVAFIIVRSALTGTADREWLAFAGAVVGTGLAVAGAVWIEHWKRRAARRAEIRAILAMVRAIHAGAVALTKDRPADFTEAQWQAAINHMPETLRTYTARLDRALDRLSVETMDPDGVEAGDVVLRSARRAVAILDERNPDKAAQVVDALELLKHCCEMAKPMLASRLGPGKAMTFAEAGATHAKEL